MSGLQLFRVSSAGFKNPSVEALFVSFVRSFASFLKVILGGGFKIALPLIPLLLIHELKERLCVFIVKGQDITFLIVQLLKRKKDLLKRSV